ncbi:hypothetical protein RDWZM_006421 [Blomia tropicalis]|uniref:Innexin n=1 Tax=Blomia tropicalis TaxID=40697 RepID=A0A9Q0M866_BLOTA|nr:hypothetical protein BLOT_008659 [Blomia tropicalis]KAJ6220609.1 hypothetical protein RDWZM_006421 [Blomia tropicalis]
MLDEVKALASVVKSRHLHIDSIIFRLNCRLTTICLCVALFIVCTTQFVSSPIYCDSQKFRISEDLLNTHCYMHSTYRLVETFYLETTNVRVALELRLLNREENSVYVEPYPGIRTDYNFAKDKIKRVNYTYYQWIWLIYLIQAISFYFPNWIWKQLEGNRMKSLVSKIDFFDSKLNSLKCCQAVNNNSKSSLETKTNIQLFALYMNHSFGSNGFYMRSYLMCEGLAIINIVVQMFLLNEMFWGRWLSYGWNILDLYKTLNSTIDSSETILDDVNPMTLLFPKKTKCFYKRFGPSGSPDNIDALWSLRTMVQSLDIADWFILNNVGRNLDSQNFYEALAELIKLRQARMDKLALATESQRDDASISNYFINGDDDAKV